MNRRKVLQATCAVPFASPVAAAAESLKAPWTYDSGNLEELVRAYVKVIGALDKRQIYLQYFGEIVAIIPGEIQQPLFRLKGLVRQRWAPNDDGSYSHSNFDHGLFCDWDTGQVMTEYENPFTGEVDEPLHYNSGEISDTYGVAHGQSNPANLQWRTVGNRLSISADRIGREFPNPVRPELYPRASTGPKVQYSWLSTYFADAREVEDPSLAAVEADHVWEFVTNFPAWMRVGNKAGLVLWRWAARKFMDEAQIDPYILEEIEKRKPGFLTVDKPWPERSDGWTQYSRERKPEVA